MICNSGVDPAIVEYLGTPPGPGRRPELASARGIPVRELPKYPARIVVVEQARFVA
jgi:hypothetical protein